ncbi:Brf1-like TBP-binding [Ostreococcus tauri]|uniref:Brf1-like TBP-binding n=1 Tax=Ostreococcus tauri TaxID=70448 RepID=A0A096P825_OSTTA|nr:Brf1-like TBP-binding [Ostreococcus tauri]OUS46272.1 transcription factor IIB [Ostreococcus tauri]CEG00123.1 Brf1-like TBP-binding [Ostreococcus tauri]|eukprot:XP_003082641.2 Brf1-like TBP-binding [Ostreococcus tauri]
MVHRWCDGCAKRVAAETNESNGFTCCTQCGKILHERVVFSGETTFTKNAQGASVPDGMFVPENGIAHGVIRASRGGRLYGVQLDSHERTLYRGKLEIKQVADRLAIRPREDVVDAAHRLYKLAVQRNFTRGRRVSQVAGACLYIICRQESRPYMLIDFADVLQTNVYVLGAVFLQLCRLLRLEQHPLMQKPIDPSLFIHRFADKLSLGRRMHTVANTALRLVASMKRDWMQTGRRPNGICGAALWVAAHIHGFNPSKRDVVAVVHVGEATLKKRLSEFENTPSAALSVEEFDTQARTYEIEEEANRTLKSLPSSSMSVLSCVHKDSENTPHFAHGMCRSCYIDYVRISGGSMGGADPPAFMRAKAIRKAESESFMLPSTEDLVDDDKISQEFKSALEVDFGALLNPQDDSRKQLALTSASTAHTHRLVGSVSNREPVGAGFLLRAEESLRLLVGSRWAELVCLPFTSDLARGRVSKEHMCELHPKYETFSENEGERIAQVDEPVLHFLIAAECFDDEGLDHLAKYSPHDVKALEKTRFDPAMANAIVETADGLVPKRNDDYIDTLSDVDDDEIDSYIHDENEVKLRRVVWAELNKEYLEGQALKEQTPARTLPSTSKRKKKVAVVPPAETPAEAVHQALSKKKGSSKINYEVLENLFKVSDPQPSAATNDSTEAATGGEKTAPSPETRRSKASRRRPAGLPQAGAVPRAKRHVSGANPARPSGLVARKSKTK